MAAFHRFHVIFSLSVYRVEGLPASLDGVRLAVNWDREEEGVQTLSVSVVDGTCTFNETLRQRCTICSRRNANGAITYEPKIFTVSVVALDTDEVEIGKEQFDLTKLLPELDDAKPAIPWSTNLKLKSMDEGSTLILTFSYDIVHNDDKYDYGCVPLVSYTGHETSASYVDLDEELDLVAGEFLNLLDMGDFDELNSPEVGGLELIGNAQNGTAKVSSAILESGARTCLNMDDEKELAEIMKAAELELQEAAQTMWSRSRVKVMEDIETQALMQEWGLSEKSFEVSPPKSLNYLPARVSAPPSLGEGLGPAIDFKDGSSLRVMSPMHFPPSSHGLLAMQVSRPVVVPSASGSSAVDVMRHLASLGTENLARQAMAAMPLEDIAGKSAEDITGLGAAEMHGFGEVAFQHGNAKTKPKGRTEYGSRKGLYDTEYVSLEDLAPLAMQNIEALAIDGLKIQAGMAEKEAPSYLDAAAWGTLDMMEKSKNNIGMSHGVVGICFNNSDTANDLSLGAKQDDPFLMALTLEEWTKLDSGVYDEANDSREQTLAILAAHNAQYNQLTQKGRPKSKGIMGNALMIAMLVQLRDPLQNFEPVGAPMMALVQAERLVVPPKPKFCKPVSTKGNSEEYEVKEGPSVPKMDIPEFRVTGVHISGLKAENDEVKSIEASKSGWWGSQKQLQAGSRWLAAQGMGKSSKLKSTPVPALTHSKGKPGEPQAKVKSGETLWNISSRVANSGNKWRDAAKLGYYIRNPDVKLSNNTRRK